MAHVRCFSPFAFWPQQHFYQLEVLAYEAEKEKQTRKRGKKKATGREQQAAAPTPGFDDGLRARGIPGVGEVIPATGSCKRQG